jgi:UrcA family protein
VFDIPIADQRGERTGNLSFGREDFTMSRFDLAPKVAAAIRATTALLALTLFTTAAIAGTVTVSDDAIAMAVPYGDLDLSTNAGNRTLYARLTSAAKRVCPRIDNRDLQMRASVDACRAQALARAVRAIDSPALAALHRQDSPAS